MSTARVQRCQGLSYVEVLIAIALIAMALVPALESLQPGLRAGDVAATQTRLHFHLSGKLEEVLAQPFNVLDAEAQAVADPTVATAFSDPVGAIDRRIVLLTRYDADNADGDDLPLTGIDPGLLRVQVRLENDPGLIETLVTIHE